MTQQQAFDSAVVKMIAGQIKRYRKEKGWSAQELADACAALGYPIPRTVLANLETGRRSLISVAEVFILARALDVAPISLIFPLGTEVDVQLQPGEATPTWEAMTWFTGELPAKEEPPEGSPWAVLHDYRLHWNAVVGLRRMLTVYQERQLEAVTARSAKRREELNLSNTQLGFMIHSEAHALYEHRREMADGGYVLPALPDDLAFVDEDFEDEGDDA
ncbi:helix-turn-helix transcriptional regulator [Embleya sp. NPDC020630]|uniref:helix-turn-helix transcriptional regulator n=1 Tax=Embleya sp. NPDC020630 TaxID=3363979 RepID=UPI00379B33C5